MIIYSVDKAKAESQLRRFYNTNQSSSTPAIVATVSPNGKAVLKELGTGATASIMDARGSFLIQASKEMTSKL